MLPTPTTHPLLKEERFHRRLVFSVSSDQWQLHKGLHPSCRTAGCQLSLVTNGSGSVPGTHQSRHPGRGSQSRQGLPAGRAAHPPTCGSSEGRQTLLPVLAKPLRAPSWSRQRSVLSALLLPGLGTLSWGRSSSGGFWSTRPQPIAARTDWFGPGGTSLCSKLMIWGWPRRPEPTSLVCS